MTLHPFPFRNFSNPVHGRSGGAVIPPESLKPFVPMGKGGMPPPVEESFSREELERARAEGQAQGKAEGMAHGLEQGKSEKFALEQQVKAQLQQAMVELTTLNQQVVDSMRQLEHYAVGLAKAIAEKVVARQLDDEHLLLVQQQVQRALPMLADVPKLTVQVNPELVDAAKEWTRRVLEQQAFDGEIIVKPDESLAQYDCRVRWQDGQTEHRLAERWQHVLEALSATDWQEPAPGSAVSDAAGVDDAQKMAEETLQNETDDGGEMTQTEAGMAAAEPADVNSSASGTNEPLSEAEASDGGEVKENSEDEGEV